MEQLGLPQSNDKFDSFLYPSGTKQMGDSDRTATKGAKEGGMVRGSRARDGCCYCWLVDLSISRGYGQGVVWLVVEVQAEPIRAAMQGMEARNERKRAKEGFLKFNSCTIRSKETQTIKWCTLVYR